MKAQLLRPIILFATILLVSTPGAFAAPGVDWQTVSPKQAVNISDAIWHGAQYVAVGPLGSIQTSPDGITWTAQNSGTSRDLVHIIWGNSEYVAVGANGTILTSPDAINWTAQISGSTDVLNSIAWNGSQYVVVGGTVIDPNPFAPQLTQTVLTSPDGIAWTVRVQNTGATQAMFSVAWGGTQFVAVGYLDLMNSQSGIWTSPDGITWTPGSIASPSIFSLGDVIWNGAQFAAVGAGINPISGVPSLAVLTSTDGILWTEQTAVVTPLNSNPVLNRILWTGTQFVTVGPGNNILTSPDAITWSLQNSGLSPQTSFGAIAWNGTQFILAGLTQGFHVILTSPDGVNWARTAPPPITSTFTDVVWTGSRFVAVGVAGAVATSTDGISWAEQISGYPENLVAATWGGGRIVAIGSPDPITGDPSILTSPDGIIWSQFVQPPGLMTVLQDVVWGGSQFVTMDDSGTFFTSTDGQTWVSRGIPSPGDTFTAITWNGTQFVAVGAMNFMTGEAVIVTSPDGINWTSRTSGVAGGLVDITWGGSQFVAIDINGSSATSPDGINWTVHPAPELAGMSKITSDGTQFVAVGLMGSIATSSDGAVWAQTISGAHVDLLGIVWSGTQFVTVGAGGTILRSPVIVPAISLTLNQAAYVAGNTLAVTVTTTAGAPSVNADIYIALQLPDGTLLVMQPGGSFSTALTPLVSNIPVPDFNGPIFNFAFSGTEPAGNYTWFAALTTPGTLNIIGTMAVQPFSFGP